MSDGQIALNTNLVSPGLFFKDSNGDSVKIGPIHVGATAPNATPGAGGQAGNSKGEAWLDTTATNPILKVFNGSAFVAVQPVGTGTVVSTTDTGTVTSTMILDGTIVNADVNASAAIAGTKISPNFGSQTIATTGIVSHALGTAGAPTVTFTGDTNTGIYSPGADQVGVVTNGVERVKVGTSEVVFNEGGVDCDFRIEGDTNPNLFVVDAGTDQVRVANINGGPLAGFRNAIINGNFDFWQRGTSFTGQEYGADRWFHNRIGTTHTVTRQSFTLGQTEVPGEPTYFCRTVVSSVAGAGNISLLTQRIEDVRSFAGQQVTISFWAKADATKNIAVELEQFFGTGGSPSATVTSIGTTKVSIGTSWQKVTVTATVSSISGKTIGTDGSGLLAFNIWFNAGSNFNSRTNSLGQQSGTFDIAQVQIEHGPVATPFERRPIGTELALCQRYYQITAQTGGGNSPIAFCFQFNTTSSRAAVPLTVTMRTNPPILDLTGTPTLNDSSGGGVTLSSIVINSGVVSNNSNTVGLVATTASRTAGPVGAWAGLNLKLAFDAEL